MLMRSVCCKEASARLMMRVALSLYVTCLILLTASVLSTGGKPTSSEWWSVGAPCIGLSVLVMHSLLALSFASLYASVLSWCVVSLSRGKYKSFSAIMQWFLVIASKVFYSHLQKGFLGAISSEISPDARGRRDRLAGSGVLWLLEVSDSIRHQRKLCKSSTLS